MAIRGWCLKGRCFMKTASEKNSRKQTPLLDTHLTPNLLNFSTLLYLHARYRRQTDRQTYRRSHTTVLYARINAHKREFESLTFRLLAEFKEEEKQTVFSKSSFENTDRSIEKNRRETTFRPHPKKTNPHQYSQS